MTPSHVEQALAAWEALTRDATGRRVRATVVREGPWGGAGPASLWALSQVLAAATDLVWVGALASGELDRLFRGLERHRHGDAYDALPGDGTRYYDDNAWVALDCLQAHHVTGDPQRLQQAERILRFVATGARDGGVYWVETAKRSRHTCSTAPAAQVALRIQLLTGDRTALDVGVRAVAFLDEHLRRPDALYDDHVDDDGTVDHAVYSYNQGTPVGAHLLRHRITGDPTDLDLARATADAALAHFSGDRLWTHPPAFNAIWFRNLLALDAASPHPGAIAALDAYLARVWDEARDPATGWFTDGGIGRYERGGALDQSALVQLFALHALPPGAAHEVC